MPTVGRILVSERLRQGLEVADIARITKLSMRAIEAMEADDFERLPGAVFARNFVRQYAQALRLDSTALVEQFGREQSISGPEFSIPRVANPRAPRLNSSALSGLFESDIFSAFATFVLTLLICAAAFYGFQFWRAHRGAPATPPPIAKSAAPIPSEAAVPPPSTSSAPAAKQIAVSSSNVHVTLSAADICWTKATADGKTLFAETLAAGDTRTIDAATVVTIRAGNASALAIQLNGKEIPPLGSKGQIREVTLTPAGAQLRTQAPEFIYDF
jgi:cytoskeleton protein RodZ